VPFTQLAQAAELVEDLNFPGTQLTHCKSPLELPEKENPTLHEQLLLAWLPMGESDARGQSVHIDEAAAVEYLPVMQRRRVAVDEAPKVLRYDPAPQVELPDKNEFEYFPATQTMQ
jgi:hypothetical protein